MMIEVRFFINDKEVSTGEWEASKGVIEYQRHTIFDNSVRQICLTKIED